MLHQSTFTRLSIWKDTYTRLVQIHKLSPTILAWFQKCTPFRVQKPKSQSTTNVNVAIATAAHMDMSRRKYPEKKHRAQAAMTTVMTYLPQSPPTMWLKTALRTCKVQRKEMWHEMWHEMWYKMWHESFQLGITWHIYSFIQTDYSSMLGAVFRL